MAANANSMKLKQSFLAPSVNLSCCLTIWSLLYQMYLFFLPTALSSHNQQGHGSIYPRTSPLWWMPTALVNNNQQGHGPIYPRTSPLSCISTWTRHLMILGNAVASNSSAILLYILVYSTSQTLMNISNETGVSSNVLTACVTAWLVIEIIMFLSNPKRSRMCLHWLCK